MARVPVQSPCLLDVENPEVASPRGSSFVNPSLCSRRRKAGASPVVSYIASPAGARYAGPLDAARWAMSAATTITPTYHRPGWVTTVVAHHRLIAVTATAFLGMGQISRRDDK